MPKSAKIQHSRRGFFHSLIADLTGKPVKETEQETQEQKNWKTKASILALRFAKNDKNMTKIGIKQPVLIENARFRVKLTGHDPQGQIQNLELEIDAITNETHPVINDSDTPEESLSS
jgi:hypothetical protein